MNFVTVTVYKRSHKKSYHLTPYTEKSRNMHIYQECHIGIVGLNRGTGGECMWMRQGRMRGEEGMQDIWEVLIIFTVVIGFPGTYALTKCADFYF